MTNEKNVPNALRKWFVVHFVADMLFAIPLLIAPRLCLGALGWEVVDPFTARLVGAALLGIGGESWLGRNGSVEMFRGMLNLKVIWSAGAVLGILLSIWEAGWQVSIFVWAVLAVFGGFNVLWVYYYRKVS